VFIDRWSRRQILVWSAPIRAGLVVITAALMVSNNRGVPLYIAVLVLSGVTRFLQASLSVALPHVTPPNKLVVANAVSDTVGGIMSALGGLVALGINAATGDTERGAAVTMLVGGGCYVTSSLVAAIMPKDLLGPSGVRRRAARLTDDLANVAAELVAGARYVLGRRDPRGALGATSAYSFLFGPLFLMSILLYRNYFYPGHVTVAESHVGTLGVISAVGYGCAAIITPPATRHLSKQAWITLMLAVAGITTVVIGETFNQFAYLGIGFLMYFCRQSVAIGSVTLLQEGVEDGFLGRVFAFYDMVYNAAYAIGATVFGAFMASDGKSPVVVAVIAAGFLVASLAYWLSSGRSPAGGSPADTSPGPSPAAGVSPSEEAQRNSS
jgi:hypothetical protein